MEPTARASLERLREQLRNAKNIQCESGNWDYDPYMHGMANGLIMALAWAEGDCDPKFLSAPEHWIKDVSIGRDEITDTKLLMDIAEKVVIGRDTSTG